MAECYVYDAVRTPRGKGKPGGGLNSVKPVDLAATPLKAIRDRNDLDTSLVEDVVFGCVEPVGEQGGDIARIAVLKADYAENVPGVQINRFCSSGLEAVNMVASKVMAGQAELAIGGGVESMSRVPMGTAGGSWATDPETAFKTYFSPQGVAADLIATKWNYSRQQCDEFAVESQNRAAHAQKEGYFDKSIVPVKDMNGITVLDKDEHPRPGTTVDDLAKLRASFQKTGVQYGFDAVSMQKYPEVEEITHVHHAGNSSGIVDGSAAVLVGSKEVGAKIGVEPRARIRSFTSVGTEPNIMLTGPSYASEKALEMAGMTTDDIDLFEINEAFASVVLRFVEALDLDMDKVNVNGGAIALGHPLGATGAMLLGTMVDEL
jgi:acetyl-CoA C-acetyltransferase